MKLKTRLLILAGSLTLLPSCESTRSGHGSNTHEMGGPRTPRMDNSIMPNRGTPGSSSGTGSRSHEMGGPRTPRMDNSIMPGRN